MTRRLYLPPPLLSGSLQPDPDRQHYLRNVLRIRDGARIEVFDGSGAHARATVERSGRKLELLIDTVESRHMAGGPRLHLGFALLKGKALEQVLRKATELGVTDLWPLYTDHTHVPRKLLASADSDHNRAVLISACEQCGQNLLPQLHPGTTLDALFEAPPAAQMLFCDMDANPFPARLPRRDSMVLIGPEGGWSDRERTLAAAIDARAVNLGELVLRAETAPIVALAMLTMAWRAADV